MKKLVATLVVISALFFASCACEGEKTEVVETDAVEAVEEAPEADAIVEEEAEEATETEEVVEEAPAEEAVEE